MSDQLPAPPYPSDIRAKGWRFELDHERIEESDTWGLASEIPFAQACLVLMWLLAWRQEPCGSLPADEQVIRAKLRIPAAQWPKLRDVLMRGWWKASDGRLYHATLTKRVEEMLNKRRSDADRQAAKRMREAAESEQSNAGVTQESRVTPGGVGSESSTDNRLPNTEDEYQAADAASGNAPSATPPASEADTGKPGGRRIAPLPPAYLGDANESAIPAKAMVVIGTAWELPEAWGVDAEALGWKPGDVLHEAEKFRQYWTAGRGQGTRRSLKGWRQSWSNWLGKAARRA